MGRNCAPGGNRWEGRKGGYNTQTKTTVRVTFPKCEEMKVGNLVEISAPGGGSIVMTLPFPMSEQGLAKIAEKIREAGGRFEVLNS